MKAVVLTAYGSVENLVVREMPDPTPGPGDVLVHMAGASINPVDWKQRSGAAAKFMPLQFPAILGRDASGTVVALGAGVTGLAVGARVMANVPHTYAELIVGPVASWAAVPDGLDLVDAAALPLVGLTGAQLIEDAVGIREGETMLVTGATGSVGRAAVYVAKARGAKVYAGVRARHRAEAAQLGVAGVVTLDDESEIAALPPLDAIADTVGGPATLKLLGKVKPGGRIGSVVGEPAGAKERGIAVHAFLAHPDGKRLADLGRAVLTGKLVVPIARRFPLAQAGAAQAFAEAGAGGKVILVA
jgi:NADPH:quinone reductase-like Zn-dependent oxidoreductase